MSNPEPVLHGSARALFEPAAMVIFSTTNADGSPQVSMVGAQLDGDEIVLVHRAWYQKLRNIRRNPRVAVTVVPPPTGVSGPQPYLVVHGVARIQEGDAGPWQQRLLDAMEAAMPADAPRPPRPDPPPDGGFTTHITPVRLGGVGPWAPPPS